MRKPSIRGHEEPELPAYFKTWVGSRVEWTDGKKGPRAGLVINAKVVGKGPARFLSLTIAADDGFLVYLSDKQVAREPAQETGLTR